MFKSNGILYSLFDLNIIIIIIFFFCNFCFMIYAMILILFMTNSVVLHAISVISSRFT
jgi:hypothetical protein